LECDFTGQMPFLLLNEQCWSTERNSKHYSDPEKSPTDLVLCWFTNWLQREGIPHPFCQLSVKKNLEYRYGRTEKSKKYCAVEFCYAFLITSPVRAVAKYYDGHICLCVCPFVWQDISGDTHAIFTKFFVHVAYHHGSVLLRQSDKIPGGRGSFGGFPPHCQCIVTHSLQITSSSSRMNHSVTTEGVGSAQHSEQKGLSYDQLRAATLIGRNAITWRWP